MKLQIHLQKKQEILVLEIMVKLFLMMQMLLQRSNLEKELWKKDSNFLSSQWHGTNQATNYLDTA